jgi:hypothetical protein
MTSIKSKNNKGTKSKSNQQNIKQYGKHLLFNSALILLVFGLSVALLHYLYSRNKYEHMNLPISHSNKVNDTPLMKQIRATDRFVNVVLNDLGNLNGNNIYLHNNNDKYKVLLYQDYFNKPTQDAIHEFATNKIPELNKTNLHNMTANYNAVKNELDNILENLNDQLLKQLQRNYARTHKINTERNIDLENIDYLPQRFD